MEPQEKPFADILLPVVRKETETAPIVNKPIDTPPAQCGPLWDEYIAQDTSQRAAWLKDNSDRMWADDRVWPCVLQGHEITSNDFWDWIVTKKDPSEQAVFFVVDKVAMETVVIEHAPHGYDRYLKVEYDPKADTVLFDVVEGFSRERVQYSFLLLTAILRTYPTADEFWFVKSVDRDNILFKVRVRGAFHYFDLSDNPADITDI